MTGVTPSNQAAPMVFAAMTETTMPGTSARARSSSSRSRATSASGALVSMRRRTSRRMPLLIRYEGVSQA